MLDSTRKTANYLKLGLININSFKECSEDRTSELNTIFNKTKAHIYILTETKLTKEKSVKFHQHYLGKLWLHSTVLQNDASAGVSIAYDALLGAAHKLEVQDDLKSRVIAVHFKQRTTLTTVLSSALPPNTIRQVAHSFIIMGIYAPASGTVGEKRTFIENVFSTRARLQEENKCKVIMAGDFNSTIGHLDSFMRDFESDSTTPNTISKCISLLMEKYNYIHPFELELKRCPWNKYLTFECTTNISNNLKSAKGIDHFLFPNDMENQIFDLNIADDFFAGSKHKPVFIYIKDLMVLPISDKKSPEIIPLAVWDNPKFIVRTNQIYAQFLSENKHLCNTNWDALMNRVHCLGIQFKKAILKDLIKQHSASPCQDLVDKILLLNNPGRKKRDNWSKKISNVIPAIRNQHGFISNNHKDICEAAESHFSTLFANHDNCSMDDIKIFLNKSNLPKISETEGKILSKHFTIEEFNDIVKCMPLDKSSGRDNIPINAFKNSLELTNILVACANNTFLQGQALPTSLRSVLFRLIPKEVKDPADLLSFDNFRPIGLLSIAYRIISKAVSNRIQPVLQKIIGPHQFAYLQGRRAENISRIVSEMMLQSLSNPDLDVLTLKLDFRKAFDSISFQYIRCILENINMPLIMINLIMNLMCNLSGAVIINNGHCSSFPISQGTTQGSALSAIIFILCLEGLCKFALDNPSIFGAISIPDLHLIIALLAYADDMMIFTYLVHTSQWLSLLSFWGRLSGVTVNISKSLFNFWSNVNLIDKRNQLQHILINHPCPEYRNAGISDNINPGGWKIEIQADFKLLGITYSFEFSYSNIFPSNRNRLDPYNHDPTKVLISFTGKSWSPKNPLCPDPRSAAASALYFASDNIFDRVLSIRTLFVSRIMHLFYSCPIPYKILSAIQNNTNVIILSPSAIYSPYIKLVTLFKSFANGGCDHISIDSVQKSISAHSIVLLIQGAMNKFVHSTYRRDLLSMVRANSQLDGSLNFLNYNSVSTASLGYLLNLPIDCSLVLRSRAPLEYMLWKNYEALELFISLPKLPQFTFVIKDGAPAQQDIQCYQQLLKEPLWMNGLFVDPVSRNPLIPFSKGTDILVFKDIWDKQQGSIRLPNHADICSPACSHDQHCKNFWVACIPSNAIDFAAWCSQSQLPDICLSSELPSEIVSFSLDITSDNAPISLNNCTVKILTAYFTANRAGPIEFSNITGLIGWARHWPSYADKLIWKDFFQLLNNNHITKTVRTSYWKVLHRCHIPMSKKPYAPCIFCQAALKNDPFSPEHSIFGCLRAKAFWYQVFSYIIKIDPDFHSEITFMSIISLGLHNMNPNLRRSDSTVNAIHNIIGLGIQVLTSYPIDSAESLDSTLTRFRTVLRNFISNLINSKIEDHTRVHGPNPNLFQACRAQLDLDSAMWLLLVDNTPTSVLIPSWSDYTYYDPF